MNSYDEERARIIRVINERGDFMLMEDGYFHYCPRSVGFMTFSAAHELRIIADELDRLNKSLDEEFPVAYRIEIDDDWKSNNITANNIAEWEAMEMPGCAPPVYVPKQSGIEWDHESFMAFAEELDNAPQFKEFIDSNKPAKRCKNCGCESGQHTKKTCHDPF